MLWLIVRTLIAAGIIVAVSELASRLPRIGALILSLPIISILAFIMTWFQTNEINTISRLAKETLVVVPFGMTFFVPLAFCEKLHLDFWPAMLLGILSTSLMMGGWVWLGPK